MIILDPDINGCTIWCVKSNFKESFVSHLKGDYRTVLDALLPHITTYVERKDKLGNRCQTLVLTDEIYVDQCVLSRVYEDVFASLGLYLRILPSRTSNVFRMERF